jgi:hypothetical protein
VEFEVKSELGMLEKQGLRLALLRTSVSIAPENIGRAMLDSNLGP